MMRNRPSSSFSREITLRAPRSVFPSSWTVIDVVWMPAGSCSQSLRTSQRRPLHLARGQQQHEKLPEPVVTLAASGDPEHLRQIPSPELEEVLDEDAEGGHHLAIDQQQEPAVGRRGPQ